MVPKVHTWVPSEGGGAINPAIRRHRLQNSHPFALPGQSICYANYRTDLRVDIADCFRLCRWANLSSGQFQIIRGNFAYHAYAQLIKEATANAKSVFVKNQVAT